MSPEQAQKKPAFEVVCHTLGEIAGDCPPFGRYRDPFGYLAAFTGRWIAMLRENPEARSTDVALILTLDGDTVVGRLALHPGAACVDGRRYRTFWLDGFYLQEEYRRPSDGKQPGGFFGGLMLLRAMKFCASHVACGAPSDSLQKAYRAAGFLELGTLKRFVFFAGAGAVARKYLRSKALWKPAAALGAIPLRAWYGLRRGFARPHLRYVPVTQFESADLEALFAGEARNYFPRDAATLNWVLRHRRELHAFLICRGDERIGYCLLKCRQDAGGGSHRLPPMRIGCLLDYYVRDESEAARRDLLLFSLDFLRTQRAEVIELQLADEILERLCREIGGLHLGGNRIFFRPERDGRPAEGSRWWLTYATSDVILLGD